MVLAHGRNVIDYLGGRMGRRRKVIPKLTFLELLTCLKLSNKCVLKPCYAGSKWIINRAKTKFLKLNTGVYLWIKHLDALGLSNGFLHVTSEV